MFWIVISLGGLALAFIKLGAYLVLFKVLTMALAVAGLVIAGLLIAMLWRKVASRRAS